MLNKAVDRIAFAGRCTVVAVALMAAVSAPVRADLVDWSDGFLLQGAGGLENPLVRVGFNPQPEPPGRVAELSFPPDPIHPPDPGHPPEPVYPVLTIPGASEGTFFQLFFAIGLPGRTLTIETPAGLRDDVPTLPLEVMDASGAPLLTLEFDFATESGGIMESIDASFFNPQPEPPGISGAGVFGLSFTFTSFSDVSVGFRVFDAEGTQFSFSEVAVPEPAGLALVGLGLVAAGAVRRRARR